MTLQLLLKTDNQADTKADVLLVVIIVAPPPRAEQPAERIIQISYCLRGSSQHEQATPL